MRPEFTSATIHANIPQISPSSLWLKPCSFNDHTSCCSARLFASLLLQGIWSPCQTGRPLTLILLNLPWLFFPKLTSKRLRTPAKPEKSTRLPEEPRALIKEYFASCVPPTPSTLRSKRLPAQQLRSLDALQQNVKSSSEAMCTERSRSWLVLASSFATKKEFLLKAT